MSRPLRSFLAKYSAVVSQADTVLSLKKWLFIVHTYLTGFFSKSQNLYSKSWSYALLRNAQSQWDSSHLNIVTTSSLKIIFEMLMLVLVIFLPVLKDWFTLTIMLLIYKCFFSEKHFRLKSFSILPLSILICISAIISGGLPKGWTNLIQLLNWLIIAWLVRTTLTPRFIRKMICFSVGSSLLWMIGGFIQRWSGMITPLSWVEPLQEGIIVTRVFSVFGNPNIYAIYLTIIIILTSYLLNEAKQHWQFGLYGLVMAMALFSIHLTYSRSGWLIAGGYLVFLIGQRFRKRGAFLVLILLLLWSGFNPDTALRLSSLWTSLDNTLIYRLHIWQGVGSAIFDFFLWGAGPGSFDRIYPLYQLGSTFAGHTHQWYLQFWLEYGFFSLLALIFLLYQELKPKRETENRSSMIVTSLFCLIIFGLVENWAAHRFMGGYFWLLMGMAESRISGGIDLNG